MFYKGILLSTLTALLGVTAQFFPLFANLEQNIGLDWLFSLRGPRPAPSEVLVVSIDRETSQHFGIPNVPRKWPRGYQAKLIETLAQAGARVIAFDIIFDEPRDPEQDKLFAKSIGDAGNVILFQYLQHDTSVNHHDDPQLSIDLDVQRLVSPLPQFADRALALAPFPLPKVPAKVNQAWTFKEGAGDAPTLPVVAFQHFMSPHWPKFRDLLLKALPPDKTYLVPGSHLAHPAEIAARLRTLFNTFPELKQKLSNSSVSDPGIKQLINVYSGEDNRFLDLYGPPHTIKTLSYCRVLNETLSKDINLYGKAVFVGFSEQLQPEQKDGFYTVFSQPNGLDVSGVEIAATTFANFLQGRSITPLTPSQNIILMITWALLISLLFMALPGAITVISAAFLAVIWGAGASYGFSTNGTWIPLVVPLLFQLPFALIAALSWRYLTARTERQQIRKAFGYYLPGSIVDELVENAENMSQKGNLVYGICLATDAERYTQLSEQLPPAQVQEILNRYYQHLFAPVRQNGGIISDVVGDAMMAIWTAPSNNKKLRERACFATLNIADAINHFSDPETSTENPLPTRLGLHAGEIFLGNVGAQDHFEYRAVGDIVNGSSRIENLNKILGTYALASKEVVQDIDSIITRDLGQFKLAGKTVPLSIHELIGRRETVLEPMHKRLKEFRACLAYFKNQQWKEAIAGFETLIIQYGEDGPSHFYLKLCREYAHTPPENPWAGIVNIAYK